MSPNRVAFRNVATLTQHNVRFVRRFSARLHGSATTPR